MSWVHWDLAGSVGTQGQQGVRGYHGALGACRGVGESGGVGGWQGCRGIRGPVRDVGVAGRLGAQPHWVPVQGPRTPTGSPWGVTYLTKGKQVTEMSSTGYYIHLALFFVTVCTFVPTPPNHIFLHAMLRNVIWTMFSSDQFTHILTPSI